MVQLKELCENYLKKFNNKRNFNSRISNAIDKDNSKTKKLCLTLIKEIFETENEPYYLFLNNKNLSNKLLKIIIKGIKEEIDFNSFKLQLFNLSIDLEFIYKISEFYYHCFSKNMDEYLGQYLNLFIFQKKFKSEYINNLLNMIGIKYKVKTYEDFLIKIKNKYNKSKDFFDELKNIFLETDNKEQNPEINSKKENNEIIQINSENNKNIKKTYTVYNYLLAQFYKNNYKKLITPILKEILDNSKINFFNIGYYDENNFDKLHKITDKTLSILISDKLKLYNEMCEQKEYGYFCYENENPKTKIKYITEALYSIIAPFNLYNYCKVDDLYNNNNNSESYIKNRTMVLDYYINISVFKEKYNAQPFPRIIFPLYNKNIDLDLLNKVVEFNGVFFVENEFSIKDDDLPFVSQYFLSFSGSNKVYNLFNFKFDLDGKTFKKNDLCLLEIKAFPKKIKYNNSETFSEVMEKMFEKMIIFEQLFSYLNINYDRIRLILFYDLVSKKKYDNDIENTLIKLAQKHNKLKYLNKICFQVIYVNANYFVYSLRTEAEDIKNLKEDIEYAIIESKKRYEEIEKLFKKDNELLIKSNKIAKKRNELLIESNKLAKKRNELLIENKKIKNKNYDLLIENQKSISKIDEINDLM